MMKIFALMVGLTVLAGCATWEGLKSDVATGAGAVEDSLSN